MANNRRRRPRNMARARPRSKATYTDTVVAQIAVAPAGVTAADFTLAQLFPGLSTQSAENRVITWNNTNIEILPTLGNGRITAQAQLSENYLPGNQFGFGSTRFKLLSHVNSTHIAINLTAMSRVAPTIRRPYLVNSQEALQLLCRLWDDEAEARSILLRITSSCTIFPQGNIVTTIPSVRMLPVERHWGDRTDAEVTLIRPDERKSSFCDESMSTENSCAA